MEDIKLFKSLLFVLLVLTIINLFGTYRLYNKFSAISAVPSAGQENGEVQDNQLQNTTVSADNDPFEGATNAPVTIIEFSDFQCPFCSRFPKEALPQIKTNYIDTGKVKLVFRDFPLPMHTNAQKAAEAAGCADEQGKFWEYHDKLFANQSALTVSDLKKYAKDLGLDTNKFSQCLDSGKMTEEVQKDLADGEKAGVTGTPTFFINGEMLVGALPYEQFKSVIDAKLAQ